MHDVSILQIPVREQFIILKLMGAENYLLLIGRDPICFFNLHLQIPNIVSQVDEDLESLPVRVLTAILASLPGAK